MKTIKYITLGLVSAVMAGCGSFFNNESPSAMDSKTVFSNPTMTEQAIFGVYHLMGGNNGYRNRIACGYQGLNTDIEWSSKSAASGRDAELMTYDCSISNASVSSASGSDLWSYLNTMIERTNNIIEGIDDYAGLNLPAATAEARKDSVILSYCLGEAHFLRAFAALEQVKYWGDVPARFVSLAKDANGTNVKKTDRNEVYEQIRKDLTAAAHLLPWSENCPGASKDNVGRASKAAAYALLARADLMYAGKAVHPNTLDDPTGFAVRFNIDDASKRAAIYQEAMEACAEIIKHEDKLAADFATPFKLLCAGNTSYKATEHIWVMPFADGRGQVLNYNAPKLSSNAQGSVPGHLPGFGNGGSSNGHICISPALIFKFDPNDKRKNVTYVMGQWEYDNASDAFKDEDERRDIFDGLDPSVKRLYQKSTQINNFYLGKYRFEWYGRTLTSTDDGVDFPVLRYGDVLLMFAEAAIGGIGGDKPVNNTGLTASAEFNKIRTRANVANVNGDLTMDNIIDERAFELCGEYVRKYDLMRWGMLKQKMVETESFIRGTLMADDTRHAAGIGDSIYFHYVEDKEIGGWVISLDALAPQSAPTTTYGYRGVKKDLFNSDSKGYVLSKTNYVIYVDEAKLESRQYWPIFSTNVDISNGTLWNNYGY